MAEKEWSENPEDDPVELQKQQLALGKEFMERLKKQEAEEKKRLEDRAAQAPPVRGYGSAPEYKPPTFEEVSAGMKKAWDEVERIMPNATDTAKSYAFQTLVHAQAAAMTGFLGS